MIVNNTAFLCGYFSVSGPATPPAGWSPVSIISSDNYAVLKKYYFPEFVRFWAEEVSCYRMSIDKDVSITLRDGSSVSFRTEELRIYMMPKDLVLCTVKVLFPGMEADLVTQAMFCLRECCYYDQNRLGQFLSDVIRPVDEAFRALGGIRTTEGADYSHLVENGNKFKVFQIIQSEDCPADARRRDRFLYSSGTLTPYVPEGPCPTDVRYFARMMQKSRIGIYNTWTALALLDTFTFVSTPLSEFLERVFQHDYFGMIYLYELYRKCILYHYNVLFREGKRDPAILQKELDEFERNYVFPSLSYNFLPAEIDSYVAAGLDIEQEDSRLNRFIAREVSAREADSDNRRERLLLFLTLLAGFSAFWDIVCLLDELVNYESVFRIPNVGYRVFSVILFLVISVCAWVIGRGNRSRK